MQGRGGRRHEEGGSGGWKASRHSVMPQAGGCSVLAAATTKQHSSSLGASKLPGQTIYTATALLVPPQAHAARPSPRQRAARPSPRQPANK